MENRNNSSFYEVDEISIAKFKKQLDSVAFRCRIIEEDCDKWKKLFGKTPVKKPTRDDKAKINYFQFTQLNYDNSTAKDETLYHGNVFTTTKYINAVKAILNENFKNVSYIHKDKSISVTINYTDEPKKGVWIAQKTEDDVEPDYPICILSYGRANNFGYTHKLLTKMKVFHFLFIEKQQEKEYRDWYNSSFCELIVAENFSKKKLGSTPMRNYILDFFDEDFVWLLDDNIKLYNYFHNGKQNLIESPVIFKFIEDYVSCCENIGIASHNFNPCVAQGNVRPCMISNGKCYSSMLINNRIGLRFRHRHQEDNFISIESICSGYNTICFNAIMYDKNTSGNDKGGNHDDIYKCGENADGDGYRERFEYFTNMAQKLIKSGDITLKDGADEKLFVWRDFTMKGKEFHAKANYLLLENHDNEIVHNERQARCFNNCIKFIAY